MSGERIGIIYPPPELRNIVDKTAGFVANSNNGPQFEARVRENEANNPKFNFLNPGDPYNAYYQNKVLELREAKDKGEVITPTVKETTKETSETTSSFQAFISRGPPPPFDYSVDPPSIQAMELDIVKLTAQFAAIHGRSFLNTLLHKESRNYQFDFLRPQHGLFNYFSQLTEQYSRILKPNFNVEDLRNEVVKEKFVLEKVKHRMEFTRIQEQERLRDEEEAERERHQYNSIDWHDFVVVETVDYQMNEHGIFPPPTTPEQVGSRILLQQRIELQGEIADTEMDLEDDEVEKEEKKKEQVMPPPLPPSLDNVVIKKDYNPKVKQPTDSSATSSSKSDAFLISPITGQKIPADKIEEHMRYGLLDPRWLEERERTISEKMQEEQVFAPGVAIESSLRQLAERRTDIFGSATEETAIGRRIGEKEVKGKDKVIWDGYTSSAQSTVIAAQAKITVDDQIQDIKRRQAAEKEKEKIGPSIVAAGQPPVQLRPQRPPQQNPHLLPSPASSSILATPGMPIHAQQPHFVPHNPMMFLPPQHPMHHPLMPPVPDPSMIHAMVSSFAGLPSSAPPVFNPEDEPASKKQKTEETLVSEAEFLKSAPPVVNIRVAVPSENNKSDWKLNGQTLNFSLDIKETMSSVKNRIHESTGMPPGKQKLQFEGIFVKDSNSLAFYNMTNGSTISLLMKERGGRKK